MLTWTDAISTGIEELDLQHQLLFKKLNELEDALATYSLREAGEILGFLQFFTDLHFTAEEQKMEKRHCPLAERNQREHAYFRQRFGALYEKWQNGNESLAFFQSVHRELEDWLQTHLVEVDRHLQFE